MKSSSRNTWSRRAPYAYACAPHGGRHEQRRTVQIDISLSHRQTPLALQGGGNGPIDAFVNALGLDIKLMDYHEHSIGSGANAQAACYVELRLDNGPTLFGAAIDSNIVTASFKAVLVGREPPHQADGRRKNNSGRRGCQRRLNTDRRLLIGRKSGTA